MEEEYKDYKCGICGDIFRSKCVLNIHLQLIEGIKLEKEEKNGSTLTNFAINDK